MRDYAKLPGRLGGQHLEDHRVNVDWRWLQLNSVLFIDLDLTGTCF